MPAVIVPVIVPQQRQCIVQNGTTYCEQSNSTKQDIGGFCIIILLLLLWGFIIMETSDEHPFISTFILLLPFILGSLLIFIN